MGSNPMKIRNPRSNLRMKMMMTMTTMKRNLISFWTKMMMRIARKERI